MDLAEALAARQQRGVREPVHTVTGWLVSATSTTATVRLSAGDTPVTVPKMRGYASPVVDDVVLVLVSGSSLYCLGALNAAPTPPAEPVEEPDADEGGSSTLTPPKPKLRTRTFRPVYTGTFRDSWRGDTTDLFQGDWTGRGLNYGAAYYGRGPAGLSGTAVSGTIRVKRGGGGAYAGQRPTFRLLDHKGRPAGFPSASGTFEGPLLTVGGRAKVALPVPWVTALINGTAGGVGIGVGGASPYLSLAGRAAWSPSFELTIKWKD